MREIRTVPGVAAIVPAAGLGRRFRGRTRKLFTSIHGRPLLAYTLQALQASATVRWIQVVVRSAERERVRRLIQRCHISKALAPCAGGASRAASVAKGFAALPDDAAWVLVHDGARPCVSARLLDSSVQAAARWGAAACGLPASLTVKEAAADGAVRATLDRRRLWFVQTPQVFRRDLFAASLKRAGKRLSRFPDDASLAEAAGFRVRMVPGDPLNIKVTTREDLILAEAILGRRRHLRSVH